MGNLVASYKQYWIHPSALAIEINTFGNPNYLQASVSANSVVMAYIPDVIAYAADGNYRRWVLKAFNTHFTTNSEKYMYVRLDRPDQQTEARIVYSNERLDIYGEPYTSEDSEDNEGGYWYILLGILTATDGTTLRDWQQDYVSGSLDTSQQRNEDSGGQLAEMFSINQVTGFIDVLKQFSSLVVHGALSAGSAVVSGILQAAEGVFGRLRIAGKDITSVRRSDDDPYLADNNTSVSTTADVTKNIRSRALIRTADATDEESTVQHDLAVQGDLSASGSASVGGDATITGNLDVANGDVTIGDFQDVSGQIQGARITEEGFGTFASIKALSFQIYELIYNRIRANGGRTAFTGASGIVDAVSIVNATQHLYRLDLRTDEHRVDDKTEFAFGDIFYAFINHVQGHGYADGGQCWMHVVEVHTEDDDNYVVAQMYGQPVSSQSYYTNAYTYSGETHHLPVPYNLLPEEGMTITHWGNVSNTDRQSTFFIDSNYQNIVQLMNVDEPQISIANYGSIMGRLPSDLADYIEDAGNPVNPLQPYLYARGLVVRDLVQMDYQGSIIKTEDYRGAWSLATAQSSSPYVNTRTVFSTVTHDDAIWKCEQTGTTAEPGTDGSWTLLQSTQSLVAYKLIPTPNAFSVRADGTVVPSRSISVAVTRTMRGGVSLIATQYELTQLGLRVEYSIGRDGERTVLDIGAADSFDLEDGDPIELESGQPVMLEGEELDTAAILAQEGGRGYVYLWLVDDAEDIDIDQSTIVFSQDGQPASKVRLSQSQVGVPVDPDTHKVLADTAISFTAQLLRGNEVVAFDTPAVVTRPGYPGAVTLVTSSDHKTLTITSTLAAGTAVSGSQGTIRVALSCAALSISGDAAEFAVLYVERGKTGPMGQAGPIMYPSGTYDASVAAADDGYVNDGITTPYVYFKASGASEGRYYYRTVNDYHYDQQGHLLDPAADYAAHQSSAAWMLIPQYDAVYAKILFANFANLGSSVFWGDYMFSEYGLADGATEPTTYAAHVGDMFDDDGNLTGAWAPNYFVNLRTGAISTSKLSEHFQQFRLFSSESTATQDVFNHVLFLDPAQCHNVAIQPRYVDPGVQHCGIVFLPMAEAVTGVAPAWAEDGTHVTIINEYNRFFPSSLGGDGLHTEAAVIVSADPRLWDASYYSIVNGEGIYDYDNEEGGYFVWRGWRSKFVVLPAGCVLKLMSCRTKIQTSGTGQQEDDEQYWYVENASDFDIVPMSFVMQNNGSNLADISRGTGQSGSLDDTDVILAGGIRPFTKMSGSTAIPFSSSVFNAEAYTDGRDTAAFTIDIATGIVEFNDFGR